MGTMGSDFESRIRNVTAILGPTNTGKTHLAIERMLGHESGMIGLPLRLLAREVYDRISQRVGVDKVALITGEEKIKPERARYWVATVEAMPRDVDVDFLAIDEVQLASDPERGHVFTDRLLNARGRSETLLLGAQTMAGAISDLIPGANFISRPRLSKLAYAGEKKITRLPQRSAVVAFSAAEVYSIAELIRRQRGGTAVVLGALSPRTRNAQVALYQAGDVDFLVATDAIGMGLNLDVDHVAFSAVRKFDGQNFRNLTPSEIAQIAGRAGRHMNDGTFGVTGSCEALDADLVERLEQHVFEPVRVLQWRNRDLDFASLDRLRESLRNIPNEERLTRARMADDVAALETVSDDSEIRDMARSKAAVMRLWEVCQIPDYRKISSQNHAELVSTLYKDLMGPHGRIDEDWFARQVAIADRTDGDIDTLSNRLAHIRTWTFVSQRPDWLKDPGHWQVKTRDIEDKLSDALHECLTQRFVDRRTSALMKGMRDKEELTAEIAEDGAINVESHYVGRLKGFLFTADTASEDLHGKAARGAAAQVLSRELGMRARRVAAAGTDAFKLTRTGEIVWKGEEIAKLAASEDPLRPAVTLLADEHLSATDREKVQARLTTLIEDLVNERLKPLVEISKAEDITGLARGIAFRLKENFGVLKRESVADDLKSLDQPARAQLRKYGVRFGAFNVYFPPLLKPAASELLVALWGLKASALGQAIPDPPRAGLTSVGADPAVPEPFYRVSGYHLCGPRAVRFDMLERLADLIRPLLAWRQIKDLPGTPPRGATGDGGFLQTPEMMSILGCSPDELGQVLKALGFRLDRRPKPAAAALALELAPEVTPELAPEVTLVSAEPTAASEQPAEVDAVALDETAVDAASLTSEGVSDGAEAASVVAGIAAAGAPAAEPAVAGAAVDYEDVWRPRRPHGSDHRRKPRHEQRARTDRPRPAKQEAAAAESTVVAKADGDVEAKKPAVEPGRKDRRFDRDRKPNREHQPNRDRGDRDKRPARDGEQPRNRDRGRDRPRDGDRKPQTISAAPPKSSPSSADSPFASLGALREMLEKQSREKSSR